MSQPIAFALAALLVFTTISTQSPLGNSQRPTRPPTQTAPTGPIASGEQRATPFSGCLYRADASQGRSAEYILVDAVMVGGDGRSVALTTGQKYRVTKLKDDRLNAFVGKRVEVTGTIDVEKSGQEAEALSDLEGESIREIGGRCSAARH